MRGKGVHNEWPFTIYTRAFIRTIWIGRRSMEFQRFLWRVTGFRWLFALSPRGKGPNTDHLGDGNVQPGAITRFTGRQVVGVVTNLPNKFLHNWINRVIRRYG